MCFTYFNNNSTSRLANLASSKHENIVPLFQAVDLAVIKLTDPDTSHDLKVLYCLFLGNLAADCSMCRKELLNRGVFQVMLGLLSRHHFKDAVWVVCNLTREMEGKRLWETLGECVVRDVLFVV